MKNYVIQFSNARYFAGFIGDLVLFSDNSGLIVNDIVPLARLLEKCTRGKLTFVAIPLGQGERVIIQSDWIIKVGDLFVCKGGLTTEIECATGWPDRDAAEAYVPEMVIPFQDGLVQIVRRT